jgi:hypothetical protein
VREMMQISDIEILDILVIVGFAAAIISFLVYVGTL